MTTTQSFLESSKRLLKSKNVINGAVLAAALTIIPVQRVWEELAGHEGSGDNVTSVVTGDMGVTNNTKTALGAESLSDADTALLYVALLETKWERVEGYSKAPDAIKEALLDLTYNMGEGVLSYKGIRNCLKKEDYLCVLVNTLDTANVEGKSMMGLAKRRASAYNEATKDDIFWIRQLEDGTIVYATFNKLILSYTPKGGKHEKSKAGLYIVPNDPSGVL